MAEEKRQCSNTSCSRESCEGCPSKEKTSFLEETNELNHINKVIGIVSGKGGVGKSFVTSSLAVALRRQGYRVGILDADIHGPNIPKMLDVEGKDVIISNGEMIPPWGVPFTGYTISPFGILIGAFSICFMR